MGKIYQPPYILLSTLYGTPSAFEFHAKKYTNFSSEHPYRRRVLWRIRRFNIFLLYTEFAYRRRRLLLNIYGQSIPTSTTPISSHVLIPTVDVDGVDGMRFRYRLPSTSTDTFCTVACGQQQTIQMTPSHWVQQCCLPWKKTLTRHPSKASPKKIF